MSVPSDAEMPIDATPGASAGDERALDETAPAASDRATRRLASILSAIPARLLWPFLCLFQFGLIAGLYLAQKPTKPLRPPAPLVEPDDAATGRSTDRTGSDVRRYVFLVGRGDELLRQGRYEQALAMYQSSGDGRLASSVRFKMALCLEGVGHWDRAVAEFGEAASAGPDEATAMAARLSQARLWLRMRKFDEATSVLIDLLLRTPSSSPLRDDVVAESSYMLGLALASKAAGANAPGPRSDSLIAVAPFDSRPETQLIWMELQARRSAKTAQNGPQQAPGLVQRSAPSIAEWDIVTAAHRTSASEFIHRFVEAAELEVEWTDAARELADGRETEISAASLPCPILLTCLTEPVQLAWQLTGKRLQLASYPELEDSVRGECRGRTARLNLLAAIRNPANKSMLAAAYHALGELAILDKQPDEAIQWFERLVTELPRSSQAVHAHFNLGVVRRSLGQTAAARDSFYRVVDGSPAHVLTPLSYLILGRIQLDEGDAQGALVPLRRAVAMGTGTDIRPAAVIDLGTALLLSQNARAVGTMLNEHREVIHSPPYRAAAAFLATYAKYSSISDRKSAQREGRVMITALMGLQSDTVLPPAGVLLVARAYRDLGLFEQMEKTLDGALRRGLPEHVAREISFELAEQSLAAGRYEEAVERFEAMSGGTGSISRRAGLRLAEIALAERRASDCLSICRQLIDESSDGELGAILLLMGKAFEMGGDHAQAALCFSGQLPVD